MNGYDDDNDGGLQMMQTEEPRTYTLLGRYICPYCGRDWSGNDVAVISCCGEIGHCEEYDPAKHD